MEWWIGPMHDRIDSAFCGGRTSGCLADHNDRWVLVEGRLWRCWFVVILRNPLINALFIDVQQKYLPLHPGDWFTQNVWLGYHLLFSDLNPDLIVVDHSARYIRFFLKRVSHSRVSTWFSVVFRCSNIVFHSRRFCSIVIFRSSWSHRHAFFCIDGIRIFSAWSRNDFTSVRTLWWSTVNSPVL